MKTTIFKGEFSKAFYSLFCIFVRKIMTRKQHVYIEIDKLTNSIENVITGEVFATEITIRHLEQLKQLDKEWL